MRLLKLTRVEAALVVASLVCPLVVSANSFSPDGSERLAVGNLRGDQTWPQAAINAGGGYIVWQDNNSAGGKLGIKAQRLDASLAKAGPAFRVNLQTGVDQEKPQVALLGDGGAVFVWHGGRQGFERVFARFMNAGGVFVSGDIRVSGYTNGFQRDASVAKLADGSVVIVWSSYGQDGSMQGVFSQRFSPDGSRMGGEIAVNQFTSYNQRTPVVAGLTNGNYVVAWVSELQRGSASVDIYAQVFQANGTRLGGEFVVNTDSEKTTANPTIAASLLNGTFAIAWGQDDNRHLAPGNSANAVVVTNAVPRSNRGWDVMARTFGASGNSLGSPVVVNQTTYGDQYAPVIRAFGEDFGVVWTSLGQDGSREGVYGQFLNSDGSLNGAEFRVNTETASRQMFPSLASDNQSRLLAVWTTFLGGGNGFDIAAQPFSSAEMIPAERLVSQVPQIREATTGRPKLDVISAGATTDPVANGIALAVGSYDGLFYDRYGVSETSSGNLTLKTTSKGGYTGKIQLSGVAYPIKGTFDESGWAVSVIKRKNNLPLTVYLQIDLGGGNSLRGAVSDGDWWSEISADKNTFNKVSHPSPFAGRYTLVVKAGETGPHGDGIGTLTVDAAGVVSFKGTMADGSKMVQKSQLSENGQWPMYSDIGKGRGVLVGWVKFATPTSDELAGDVVITRAANPLAVNYSGGFADRMAVVGSRYAAPLSGQKVLNLTGADLTLSGANLVTPLAMRINIGANNVVTGDAALKMSFASADGSFKGTVNTGSGAQAFQGVVLQKRGEGAGYFLNGAQGGLVRLTPVE